MSRIGKKIVLLPAGVEVTAVNGVVTVKGPKGTLTRTLPETVIIEQTTNDSGAAVIAVTVSNPDQDGMIWGTARAHMQNMVTGVVEPWKKGLELNGVGYRMNLQGKKLTMALGFSHEVVYMIPEGVDATLEGNTLTLSSPDKDIVGKVASELRALKKPEPYKGKGFRYTDEVIRRKAGKAAKGE